MIDETMAYLAGLFDGEGCVTYKQRGSANIEKESPKPTIFSGVYELK